MRSYALSGTTEHFTAVYRLLQPRLRRFLLRRQGHQAEVINDVIGETFLKIITHRAQYSCRCSAFGWATRICLNQLHDVLKSEGRFVPLPEDDLISLAGLSIGPEHVHCAKEINARLAQVLEQMNDNHRTAFQLIRVEGLSHEVAGQVMGVPTNTVSTWLHRAEQTLREALEDFLRDRR